MTTTDHRGVHKPDHSHPRSTLSPSLHRINSSSIPSVDQTPRLPCLAQSPQSRPSTGLYSAPNSDTAQRQSHPSKIPETIKQAIVAQHDGCHCQQSETMQPKARKGLWRRGGHVAPDSFDEMCPVEKRRQQTERSRALGDGSFSAKRVIEPLTAVVSGEGRMWYSCCGIGGVAARYWSAEVHRFADRRSKASAVIIYDHTALVSL